MFDVMTITRKGLELLAQATASNKLVIVGCDATADFTDAATAATTSARPANPLASTTEVTILSASNTSVFTRAAFIAGTSTGGGQAKSFFLYGHSANDTAHDYVICVASTNISVHIPLPGELINTYGLEFETVYSGAGDTVTVTGTANYCTLAEFNVLKERTVTTHKEGDNTAGDNQTIRGEKTFVGHLVVTNMSQNKSSSMYHNGIYYEDGGDDLAGIKGDVSTSYDSASLEMIAGNVSDPENHTKLRITHANYDDSYNGFYFIINSEDESVASIRYNDDLSDYEFYTTNIGADNLRLGNSLSFSNGVEFVVNQNNLNIGSDANPVGMIIAAYVKAPQGASVSSVEFDTGKFNYTDTKFLKNYSDDDLYIISRYNTNNVSVERLLFYNDGIPFQDTTDPLTNGKVVLTKVSGKTHTINVAEAATHAKINSSDNTKVDCPVGSVVYAFLSMDIANTTVGVGEVFAVGANKATIAVLTTNGYAVGTSVPILPAGNYKALHSIQFTGSPGPFAVPALIQRVADSV